MKFGTNIMGTGLRHLPEVANAFEVNGFESIWLPEHLVLPATLPSTYPYSDDGMPPFTPDTPVYDPWVLHAVIASATASIKLATNVHILPLRHPLETARSVATLDRISRGRVILGVGIGWLRDEFDYLGIPFGQRASRMERSIDVLRRLWRDDEIEVHDEFFDFGPAKFNPKPSAGGVTIEIGAGAERALRRAGRLGDGWIETGSASLADFERRLKLVQAGREEWRRDCAFDVTVSGPLSRDPANFAALRDLGATRVVVDPFRDLEPRPTPADIADWARRFADSVITRHP